MNQIGGRFVKHPSPSSCTHSNAHVASTMERAPPPPFLCPINQDVMETPVVGPDGWSYDRAAIEQALRRNPVSPMTRQPMTMSALTPNYALRDAIEAWRREQPMAIDADLLTLNNPERVIGRGAFGKVSGNRQYP